MKKMQEIREKYSENMAELYFLRFGGNMMDFAAWRKQPSAAVYLHFLRQNRLDPEDDDEDLSIPLPSLFDATAQVSVSAGTTTPISSSLITAANPEVSVSGLGLTPIAVSTTLPPAAAQLNQQGGEMFMLLFFVA